MMQEVEDFDEQEQWAASFDMTETDCSEGVVGSLATAWKSADVAVFLPMNARERTAGGWGNDLLLLHR